MFLGMTKTVRIARKLICRTKRTHPTKILREFNNISFIYILFVIRWVKAR